MSFAVTMRSYDAARTGWNNKETVLTPQAVGSNLLTKLFSLNFDDDLRLEAQPLYVPKLQMAEGKVRDVAYVCTMANNVWAFDMNDGKPIWGKPLHLGTPVKPGPDPHNAAPATEIDRWGINQHWGILSTPVIDVDTKTMYAVSWTSADQSVASAHFKLHAIDIVNGSIRKSLTVNATADAQVHPGETPARFIASRQKQRASLLLATIKASAGAPRRKIVFVAAE